MRSVVCAQPSNAILGEGPNWDRRLGVLYWVDIVRPAVFRYEPGIGQTGHWPMPAQIGCVVPTRSRGRLAFADVHGFGFLDLSSGELTRLSDPEADSAGTRFNDG